MSKITMADWAAILSVTVAIVIIVTGTCHLTWLFGVEEVQLLWLWTFQDLVNRSIPFVALALLLVVYFALINTFLFPDDLEDDEDDEEQAGEKGSQSASETTEKTTQQRFKTTKLIRKIVLPPLMVGLVCYFILDLFGDYQAIAFLVFLIVLMLIEWRILSIRRKGTIYFALSLSAFLTLCFLGYRSGQDYRKDLNDGTSRWDTSYRVRSDLQDFDRVGIQSLQAGVVVFQKGHTHLVPWEKVRAIELPNDTLFQKPKYQRNSRELGTQRFVCYVTTSYQWITHSAGPKPSFGPCGYDEMDAAAKAAAEKPVPANPAAPGAKNSKQGGSVKSGKP